MSKTSTVKNPLTIIAIFAGLTEVGGTGVLPLLSSDAQSVYIWFLMIFPIFLVVLFFCTLNFNREVLYAPSDWSNEDNFFRKLSKVSPEERLSQVEEEIEDAQHDGEGVSDEEVGGGRCEDSVDSATTHSELKNDTDRKNRLLKQQAENYAFTYRAAEEFGLSKLAGKLKLDFRSGVRFSSNDMPNTIFDGLAIDEKTVHLAEVKYSRTGFTSSLISRFSTELAKFKLVRNSFLEDGKDLVLHLVVVAPSFSAGNVADKRAEERLLKMARSYGVNTKIHVFPWVRAPSVDDHP
ncbi:hypothetical protein PhaeoP75_00294 [Phaeobacter gallaeciensis]|uniref:Uncharacterized protein n=2 Tax=Phaeobacter gallaeciensis TaxID=60890 RepID=A0AAC9Z6N8_9RHOB|nr:hypothetical protein Gal_00295 [Phaeobacter gallaeciensis DSM 26640]ATE91360.1 hypothetical protein PhaeoP11_00293 [Phaeobacter gallaeciensis]ATE95636.1 hypothetical protein PhaeoP73_00294 [Phaeobacter gallaeciensis]ATE99975.1 hypothetical protein PhaeoP75_00294 [Phaeobacter gallaeciensis]ATF04408.1 hypothetical protein PhaeoP63_00294 [Phaeobacter gallaeciensis]